MGPLYYLSHIRSSACGANATGASEGVSGAQTGAVFGNLMFSFVASILDAMLTLLATEVMRIHLSRPEQIHHILSI